MGNPYNTPAAFRRAMTDRLRAMAFPDGPWSLPDLERQFAYDRLLVRLYLLDDGWILKGSTALLARQIAVRHTIDVDVYRAGSRKQSERNLRRALRLGGVAPALLQPAYRAYPLLDHIADKTCAILERQGTARRPSTRFKDLVDLVTLVAHALSTPMTNIAL